MATWIAHLQLADNLLKYGFDLEIKPFLIGSLAPDAGYLNTQNSWYPSKKITHFFDDENQNIQPEDFYYQYIHQQTHSADTYAFLMGYYAHLLADVEWIGNVWRPFKHTYPSLGQNIENDTDFAYQFKQLEWFGHDFLYLKQNPDYEAFKLIEEVQSLPNYLDFLPSEMLATWLQDEVINTYADEETMQKVLVHDFLYFSPMTRQAWLDCATGTLIEMFKGKRVPCPIPRPLWGVYIQPYA